MSDPSNINTASLELLENIKNIGQKRASIILEPREKKGFLTLEDLKLLEGIPNTIWNPLMPAHDIIIERPSTETLTTDPAKKIKELEDLITHMKEIMHQKDKQVAAMNEESKAKMSEQESRFDAEIQLIRHENKVREGAINQEHEQIKV